MSTLLIYIPAVWESSYVPVSLLTSAFQSNTPASWIMGFLSTFTCLQSQYQLSDIQTSCPGGSMPLTLTIVDMVPSTYLKK